ncbi:hypothetical protein O4H49_03340 [Kiloniella laminariae]|uniref:Phage-Barnase-EndoU-ColicinE5/D-RelE-like nuclease domain-containing protein n=1 Tax=Kiloniella laminariae TaxID=454162 RepID=A0ABT4LFD2_9PROT|nr:hypothetical protein [Kiloniella laminariae]MCZ4279798.1 hypothetical protein [Kiloniella laminariae]
MEDKIQEVFGLEPGIRRPAFIPLPRRGSDGNIDWGNWTAPQVVYDLAKTVALPKHALDGGEINRQDTVDAALNMTGGGFLSGSALLPRTAQRNAAIFGMSGARTPLYRRSTSSVKEFASEISEVIKTGTSSKNRLFREDLGEITIDLGTPGNPERNFKKGWGLSHIAEKRTAEDGIDGLKFVKERLPKILAEGRLTKLYGPENGRRADIETSTELVTLSLKRQGKNEVWVVTGFIKY